MEREEQRDSEVERELDSLYRKVAGLDQPGDDRQEPIETRARQTKKRRFRIVALGGGLFSILLFLGVIGVLHWQGWEIFSPPNADPAGAAGSFPEKESRRSPVHNGIIALTAEETRALHVPPESGKAPTIGGRSSAADLHPGDRQERYAIQIRAYPEGQKQNALAFLEDVRKRAPDVTMETVSIAGRGVWHRILLGDFSTADEAAAYQENDRATREYPYGFIQRRYGRSAVGEPPPRSPYPGS